MKQIKTIQYQELSLDELSTDDRQLMDAAITAAHSAYAPYSHFRVGTALRLEDGNVVYGSNQENIAYPSGLCAERTALFAAAVQYPNVAVKTLAIVGRSSEGNLVPALPCGACRQVMIEQRLRQGIPMRVLCYQKDNKILFFEDVDSLLPFAFSM